MQATCPANLIVLHRTTLTISGEQNTSPCTVLSPSTLRCGTHQFLHHTGTSYGPNVYVDRSVCNTNRMFLRLDIPLCFKVNNYVIPINTTRQFLLLRNSELMFVTSALLSAATGFLRSAWRRWAFVERRMRSALRLASFSSWIPTGKPGRRLLQALTRVRMLKKWCVPLAWWKWQARCWDPLVRNRIAYKSLRERQLNMHKLYLTGYKPYNMQCRNSQ